MNLKPLGNLGAKTNPAIEIDSLWDEYNCLAINLEPLENLSAKTEPVIDHMTESLRETMIQA